MTSLLAFAEILVRAASLLALAAAPPLFSPEPRPSASPLLEGALSLALLTAVALAAARVRARLRSREALAGGALLVVAVVASIVCATVFRGPRAPLGRGLLWVAVPLWAGLAVIAGAVAARRLGDRFKNERLAAAVLVIGGGVSLLASQSSWLFAKKQMWWRALAKDGQNPTALAAVLAGPERARDPKATLDALDRCVALSPSSCACLSRRARLLMRRAEPERALRDAEDAVLACPRDPAARGVLMTARAYRGDPAAAEREARAALAEQEHHAYRYALALALDALGRHREGMDEAKRAADGGGGRDASMLLGVIAVHGGELEAAQRAFAALAAADPRDAEAVFNLAYVADKRDRYNDARQGYLAALKADPSLADARYNLINLTLRHRVGDEARHHAKKFAEAYPSDPRNAEIKKRIAAASAAPAP